MNNGPLITVYITNYNYGSYIEKSINSVLQQTYKNFELFIIDDGSTDNSKEIIEKYRYKDRVEIIYNQNVGLNASNNLALSLSRGKYFIRLDADDFLELNALELLLNHFESKPSLGMVFSDYYYIDSYDNILGKEMRLQFSTEVTLLDFPAHGACSLISVEKLKAVGGYDESVRCQDGYDIWLKITLDFGAENVNTPLFYYRQHPTNLTRNVSNIIAARRKLKSLYVQRKELKIRTWVIIPIRSSFKFSHIAENCNGDSILNRVVNAVLKSCMIEKIFLTSSSEEILNYCSSTYSNCSKVITVPRKIEEEFSKETLISTILRCTQHDELLNNLPGAVMTVSPEYPFQTHELIEECIHTMLIFNSDSVVSVTKNLKSLYRQSGDGLVTIFTGDSWERHERDSIFKPSGGVMLSKYSSILESGKSLSGRIAHVEVDKLHALQIIDEFEYNLYVNAGLL